jgi:hypothetical protein
MNESRCRLFVITAAAAPKAIILRRGPSKWYHLTAWDMEHDTFEGGAWLHGRIYEQKCDLSPDGNLFVYFAHNIIAIGERILDSYTALSRPPWLHALVIWPQGTTYGGGGRFCGNRQLSLRPVYGGDAFPALPRGLQIVEGPAEYHKSTNEVEAADWTGRDHHYRLIYTIGGKLFRVENSRAMELADFASQKPDPQPPPESAKRPL